MAKAQTIGYNYFVGMHFVLCHGPVDGLLRIQVDNRDVWLGQIASDEEVYLDAPELFGGKTREGGVTGYLDFMSGGLTQVQNAYLLSQLGDLTPAYRGVASVVLKQVCVGMNPYLKPWNFALQRIHIRQDGYLQWYDEKSEITAQALWSKKQKMYFALDASKLISGNPESPNNDYTVYLRNQMYIALDKINDVRKQSNVSIDMNISVMEGYYSAIETISKYDMQDADFQFMKDWLLDTCRPGYRKFGFNYFTPIDFASDWFYTNPNDDNSNCGKTLYWITGGVPAPLASINQAIDNNDIYNMIYRANPNDTVNIYAININSTDAQYSGQFDNTLGDGVPNVIVTSKQQDDLALVDLIFYSATQRTGTMNPAHIIRECLTDPKWGMGYQDSDIDDAAFMYAADILYSEQMGISILWDAESTIEEFIALICKHIDATLFLDRHTGLFVLKLVRADYDKSTLLVLDPSNILSIADFTRPSFGELINSVTVTYHSTATDGPATLSVQDIALANQQRVTINASVTYDGFVNPTIASKVAQRDLRSLSTPLISCTIIANQDAKDLNIGSVFKLTWPDYEIADVVMRATAIAFGDGKTNRIRITCVQDVFSFPLHAFIAAPPPLQPGTGQTAQPITQRMTFEVPYLQLVQEHGQTAVDAILSPANSPDVGYVGAAAARPSDAEILARIYTNSGAGYADRGSLDFCPSAILNVHIDRMVTQFAIRNVLDPENITVGSWLQIDDELMAVQQMDSTTITVKRAVLDTVPYEHAIDSVILFWDTISDKDETEYVLSDSVDVKLTSVSGTGELPLASAAVDTVTIGARAIRPYPPANVKVNGLYFPTEQITGIVLTWVARNRLQQTAAVLLGFTDPGITPEPNTLYTVRVYDHNDLLLHEVLNVNALTYTVPTDIVQNMAGSGTVSLGSVRDGWYSTWLHNIPLTVIAAIPPTGGTNTLDFVLEDTGTNTLDFVITEP